MTNLPYIIALGFLLGMRHATDPDHVVAISTIVSRDRRLPTALKVGAAWGVGHTTTIMLVGILMVVFSVVIPPRLGLALETCVAVMLIALGVSNILKANKRCTTCLGRGLLPNTACELSFCDVCSGTGRELYHEHFHDDEVNQPLIRSLCIGLVHGLAGSAAIALLVLATIHQVIPAVVYLGVFGVGTIAGMTIITGIMAVPLAATKRSYKLTQGLGIATSIISIGFGTWLFYKLAIVGGLFATTVKWIPS